MEINQKYLSYVICGLAALIFFLLIFLISQNNKIKKVTTQKANLDQRIESKFGKHWNNLDFDQFYSEIICYFPVFLVAKNHLPGFLKRNPNIFCSPHGYIENPKSLVKLCNFLFDSDQKEKLHILIRSIVARINDYPWQLLEEKSFHPEIQIFLRNEVKKTFEERFVNAKILVQELEKLFLEAEKKFYNSANPWNDPESIFFDKSSEGKPSAGYSRKNAFEELHKAQEEYEKAESALKILTSYPPYSC